MTKCATEDLFCSISLKSSCRPAWTRRINGRVQAFQAPRLMIHSQPRRSSPDGNKTVIYCLITNKIYNSRSATEGLDHWPQWAGTCFMYQFRGNYFCYLVVSGSVCYKTGQHWSEWNWHAALLATRSGWTEAFILWTYNRQNVACALEEDNCGHASVRLQKQTWQIQAADSADVAKTSFTPKLFLVLHIQLNLQDSCTAKIPQRFSTISLPSSTWSVFVIPFRKQDPQAATANYRQRHRVFIQSCLYQRALARLSLGTLQFVGANTDVLQVCKHAVFSCQGSTKTSFSTSFNVSM